MTTDVMLIFEVIARLLIVFETIPIDQVYFCTSKICVGSSLKSKTTMNNRVCVEGSGAPRKLSSRRAIKKSSVQIDNESNRFLVRQGTTTTRQQKVDVHS
jgi:hypothetical protein